MVKQHDRKHYRALFSSFPHPMLSQGFGTQVLKKSRASIFVCRKRVQGTWEQQH